jgi:hypothetical protein
MRFESSIAVIENLSPPEEPTTNEEADDSDAGFEAPWDIPDPVAIQGLDCVKSCAAGEAGTVYSGEGDETNNSSNLETVNGGTETHNGEAGTTNSGEDNGANVYSNGGTNADGTESLDRPGGCSIGRRAETNGLVLIVTSLLLLSIRHRPRR